MSDIPGVSEGISSFLDQNASHLVKKKSQVESEKSKLSSCPPEPSSVPKFLASKLLSLQLQVEYLDIYQYAIISLRQGRIASPAECREGLDAVEKAKLLLKGEAIAIKMGEDTIVEDMSHELKCSASPDTASAYASAMMHRVDTAVGNQRRIRFHKSRIREETLEYYGASRPRADGVEEVFCHLSGWQPSPSVTVARLVPKYLEEDQLAYLFGNELKPATDPRNALPLCRNFQHALDSGDIVFVPVVGMEDAWKCVVTKSDGLDFIVSDPYTWKDIHGRHLQFNNGRRPRKQYLFFRYLITYLHHMEEGNSDWAKRIDYEFEASTSPGEYTDHSPLRILLQQAIGQDLPETMFRMFDNVAGEQNNKKKDLRKEQISYVTDTAVRNTYLFDPESESDEKYED